MKIRHGDIVISDDNPFENCKLDRKKYASILTSIIKTYADGFVLTINNEWGTGKTTFIKMWQKQLDKDGYKTLYFNAWENDFDHNPLVAIMAELKHITPKSNDEAFKGLLKKGAILSKNILPALIKAVANKYIDSEALTETLTNIGKSAVDIFKEEVDEYVNKKQGLVEFKSELEAFIKKNNDGKPIVFLIDELDRCRPNYAVEVLEHVKHFFSVPGIVFVLSIDKKQLGNAIRGVYGSEQINTNEYLRRFIDLEYTIPEPKTGTFCEYLYEYFQFSDFLHSNERNKYRELQEDKQNFLKMASILFEKEKTTLREQEKIFSHARIALNSFQAKNYLYPTLYIVLIFIRDFKLDLYSKIRARQISPQELLNAIEELFGTSIDEDDLNFVIGTEALMVILYNNYYAEIYRGSKIIERMEDSNGNSLAIKSTRTLNKHAMLLNLIESYQDRGPGTRHAKLDFLLNKIDLLENIVS